MSSLIAFYLIFETFSVNLGLSSWLDRLVNETSLVG